MSLNVEKALQVFGMEAASCALFAKRENAIYRVEGPSGIFAMRHHRAGYRTDAELSAELDWMAAVGAAGVSAPHPVASNEGRFLEIVDSAQVDVMTWLPGRMLGDVLADPRTNRTEIMHKLGIAAAKFHIACDAWSPSADFNRPNWNREGLTGENPVWGRFWENPALSISDATLFRSFRDIAAKDLQNANLDFGLIHADMLGENVLVDGENIRLIDFDDGGWGYRLFELATILVRHLDAPDYLDLRQSLFAGYRDVRPIDDTAFELILALRATTYVGWIADRSDLADAGERQSRGADLARNLIENYLSKR